MPEFDFDAAMRAKGLDEADPEADVEATQDEGEKQGNQLDAQSQLTQLVADEAKAEGEQQEGQDRQRDEKGRFVGKQGDGGDDEQVDGESQDQGDALILGKFKSQDDLVEAYKNLESQQGRSGNEVGELRQQLDEMRAMIQQPEQQSLNREQLSEFEEWSQEAPHEAAWWAYQNQQPRLYERVMGEWFEADPRGASRFETAIAVSNVKQDLAQQIAPTTETVQQQRTQEDFNNAWASTAQKLPDMMQYSSEMLDAVQHAPELAYALQTGDQASKERLIENLYYLSKGRQADTVQGVKDDVGRQQSEAETQEKLAATVASASSSPVRDEGKGDLEDWKKSTFLDEPGNIWSAIQKG